MKLWVDDVRPAPDSSYIWVKTVDCAINRILGFFYGFTTDSTILIDLDHDAGDYSSQGGDYIEILDWLEEAKIVNQSFVFHLHTMNPVGRENMERIIRKNGWRLV